MHPIKEKFRSTARERSGLLLFSSADAIHVIDEAKKRNALVLGIDGIFLLGNVDQPSLEDSVDYTASGGPKGDVHAMAIEFVKRHNNSDLYFDIVLGPESDGRMSND